MLSYREIIILLIWLLFVNIVLAAFSFFKGDIIFDNAYTFFGLFNILFLTYWLLRHSRSWIIIVLSAFLLLLLLAATFIESR